MFDKIKKIIPRRLFKVLQPYYHYSLAFLAALFYRFPSRRLVVIGVTGTTGKTSTVYFLANLLTAAGYKTGFTSTAVFSDGNREWLNDKKMTMPGRFFIQKLLFRMLKNNCCYAVIETTSEGIEQFRHRFINYDVLVFTGIYPEHIESHGSFENYRAAKGKLFAHLKNCQPKYVDDHRHVTEPSSELKKLDLTRISKTIIVNGDDEHAPYFLNFWSESKIAYSLSSKNASELEKQLRESAGTKDFQFFLGGDVESLSSGTRVSIQDQVVNLRLLGAFNAQNALAAAAVGLSQRLPFATIKDGLEEVRGLAGKLEMISAGQDFTAIVDYSFEPKALEKLYQVVDILPHQRIIHVLGSAGGGRDRSRRPILGEIAGLKADYVVVTNEDPYDEDPFKIMEAVAIGAENSGKEEGKDLFKIYDRREAIKKAVELAEKDDIILFTGKGAEQSICLAGGAKMPWDEREVVREAIVEKLCIDKK
jgi:UDP-N-acetylmuramoyl-L-alanyl-D-glutamate--2,6-diaminopimelate ligase